MAKKKKTIVVTKTPKEGDKLQPVKSSRSTTASMSSTDNSFLFSSVNFKWMLIGVGLITMGMILMLGGHMPSDDVWDESLIYSPRRTVLAPIAILAGLIMQIFAIFKK